MKLMIVDDHAQRRSLTRETVEDLASEIRECADAEQALRQCDEFQPDCVTIELNMEQMDGLEAARRIAAAHPLVRIIVVTRSNFANLPTAIVRVGNRLVIMKDDLPGLRRQLERRTP